MIKKLTEKEFNRRDMKYLKMFVFGMLFFIFSILIIFSLISFEGSGILVFGFYGLPVAIFGMISAMELHEQRFYPERFVYCKKCKRIIRKKHKFCSSCRCSIKRSLNEVENRKHFKEYKKFYGGKK